MDNLAEKVANVLSSFCNSTPVKAIYEGMLATLPLLVVGSIALMLLSCQAGF